MCAIERWGAKRKLRYRSLPKKVYKQLARLNRKCLRQLHDVFEGHVPLATLDAADVIPVEAGALGQLLLRIAPLVAELPQPRAKSRLNGVWGHISMLEA